MERPIGSNYAFDRRRNVGTSTGGTANEGPRDNERFKSSDRSQPREPSQVQIFVEGLPLNVKIPDLVQYFSTVGKIKIDRDTNKPRVWLYHDKQTGDPTGEATITYHDHETQKRALQTYDRQRFANRYDLKVTPSIVKTHMAKPSTSSFKTNRGRGGFRGASRGAGGRSGGGDRIRDRNVDFYNRDRNTYMSSSHRGRDDYSRLGSQSAHRHSRNY